MNENSSWELLIPQALASVRFTVNLCTGYSPYFLLFGRDVIFPLDTVLKPRSKYGGGGGGKITFTQYCNYNIRHSRTYREIYRRLGTDKNDTPIKTHKGWNSK